MTDHEFKAPERTAADPKTCTYCVEDAARLGARVEHLLGERERARDLAARLEQQVTQVEALADWHETKADKARKYRPVFNGENIIMDKAAQVHDDAAARLRAALTEAGGE